MRKALAALVAALVLSPSMVIAQPIDHEMAPVRIGKLADGWADAQVSARKLRSLSRQLERIEARRAAAEEPTVIPDGNSVPKDRTASAPSYAAGSIQEMICSYDWECDIALRVAGCESGFSPTASNGTYYGLFAEESMTSSDPAVQIAYAYHRWQTSYWSPWGWPDGAFGCAFG